MESVSGGSTTTSTSGFSQSWSRARGRARALQLQLSDSRELSLERIVYGQSSLASNHWLSACGAVMVLSLVMFVVLVLLLQVSPGITELFLLGIFLIAMFTGVHCCIRNVKEFSSSTPPPIPEIPGVKPGTFRRTPGNMWHLLSIVIENLQLAAFAFPPVGGTINPLYEDPDIPQAPLLSAFAVLDFGANVFLVAHYIALLAPLAFGLLYLIAFLFGLHSVKEFIKSLPLILFLPCMRVFLAGLFCTCQTSFVNGECVGGYTLDADSTIVCWEGSHILISLLSLAGILFYYPVFTLFQLRYSPDEITYKPKYIYYSSQIKLLLIAVTSYFTSFLLNLLPVWIGVSAFVCIVLFVLQTVYRPCNIPEINFWRSALSLITVWVTVGMFLRLVIPETLVRDLNFYYLVMAGLFVFLSCCYCSWKGVTRRGPCSCIVNSTEVIFGHDDGDPGADGRDRTSSGVTLNTANTAIVAGVALTAASSPTRGPATTTTTTTVPQSHAVSPGSPPRSPIVVDGTRYPPPRPPTDPPESASPVSARKLKPRRKVSHGSPLKSRKRSSPKKRRKNTKDSNSPKKKGGSKHKRVVAVIDAETGEASAAVAVVAEVQPTLDDFVPGFLKSKKKDDKGKGPAASPAGSRDRAADYRKKSRSRSESPRSIRLVDPARKQRALPRWSSPQAQRRARSPMVGRKVSIQPNPERSGEPGTSRKPKGSFHSSKSNKSNKSSGSGHRKPKGSFHSSKSKKGSYHGRGGANQGLDEAPRINTARVEPPPGTVAGMYTSQSTSRTRGSPMRGSPVRGRKKSGSGHKKAPPAGGRGSPFKAQGSPQRAAQGSPRKAQGSPRKAQGSPRKAQFVRDHTPSRSRTSPGPSRYADQLNTLIQMGFEDVQQNIAALAEAKGDVEAAVSKLVSKMLG